MKFVSGLITPNCIYGLRPLRLFDDAVSCSHPDSRILLAGLRVKIAVFLTDGKLSRASKLSLNLRHDLSVAISQSLTFPSKPASIVILDKRIFARTTLTL